MPVNKKHILFVPSWYPTRDHPYRGDFVQRHARAVATRCEVTVIHCIGDDQIAKIEIEEKSEHKNLREIIAYVPKSRFSWLNAIRKFRAYQRVSRLVDTPDLIHAHVIYTDLLWVWWQKMRGGLPIVITEHSTRYYQKLGTLQKKFAQVLASKSRFLLPVSKRLQLAMESHGINGNYKVVPNVVDTDLFFSKTSIDHTKPFTFLHISMLNDSHKNISGQLLAAKELAALGYKFVFEIGGNGDLDPIVDFVHQNDMQDYIHVFGALSHAEVADKMRRANAFILFSNKENQPCVIIESFACGTPVIASDVGGVAEYFPESFGTVIKPGAVDELVKAMESFLQEQRFENPNVMHAYVVENFSIAAIAKQFDEVYASVISQTN